MSLNIISALPAVAVGQRVADQTPADGALGSVADMKEPSVVLTQTGVQIAVPTTGSGVKPAPLPSTS